MRGTQCYKDTMNGLKRSRPTKRRMFIVFLKKLMDIKSPSIAGISEYVYEYDYLKAKYFGGNKNGKGRAEKAKKVGE